jgi:hypothetical protein
VERDLCAALPASDWTRMSDALILHGRRICRPRPLCGECLVADICRYPFKTSGPDPLDLDAPPVGSPAGRARRAGPTSGRIATAPNADTARRAGVTGGRTALASKRDAARTAGPTRPATGAPGSLKPPRQSPSQASGTDRSAVKAPAPSPGGARKAATTRVTTPVVPAKARAGMRTKADGRSTKAVRK